MNRQFSFKQYRGIDLTLFAVILCVTETMLIRAATRWFPDQLYTVSIVGAITAIVLMRWNGFAAIHAALGGITPALSKNCADFILACLKKANEKGLTVSFDGNFRSTLWTWEEARDFCTKALPYVNVLMGIEPYHLWKDENDHSKGDWKDGVPLQPTYEQQDEIFQIFAEHYPNLKCIARHVRFAHTGSENSLLAFIETRQNTPSATGGG